MTALVKGSVTQGQASPPEAHDKLCKGRCRTTCRALWLKFHSLFLRVRINFFLKAHI